MKDILKKIKKTIIRNRFIGYFFVFEEARFNLRLIWSIFVNALYITANLIFSFVYKDGFLLSVSLYYFLLLAMRWYLFRAERGYVPNRHRAPLYVGVLLFLTAIAMGAVISRTLAEGIQKSYSPFAVIPQALFVLYSISGALIRLSSHKPSTGICFFGVDAISLSAALFSIFNLVNFLSHANPVAFDYRAAFAAGVCASTVTLLLAVSLLLKSESTE